MVKRKVALYHSFHFDERDFRRRRRVKCSPAARAVMIHRIDIDVLTSKCGTSISTTEAVRRTRLIRWPCIHPSTSSRIAV